MNRQREQDQHGHDRYMLIHGSLSLVSAHHVAGLLVSHRVSQERGRVSESVVYAVTVASKAAFVSGDRSGADRAGDAILPYWVAEVCILQPWKRGPQSAAPRPPGRARLR